MELTGDRDKNWLLELSQHQSALLALMCLWQNLVTGKDPAPVHTIDSVVS
jgi:hypothetical protein